MPAVQTVKAALISNYVNAELNRLIHQLQDHNETLHTCPASSISCH